MLVWVALGSASYDNRVLILDVDVLVTTADDRALVSWNDERDPYVERGVMNAEDVVKNLDPEKSPGKDGLLCLT